MNLNVEIILSAIGIVGSILGLLTYVVRRTLPSVPHLLKTIERKDEYIESLTARFQKSVDEGHRIQQEGHRVQEEMSRNIAAQNQIFKQFIKEKI